MVARGQRLLVSAGTEVYVNDLSTGQLLRKFQNLVGGTGPLLSLQLLSPPD